VGFLVLNFVFVTSMGFVFPNTTALALISVRRGTGAASALLGAIQFVIGTLASSAVSAFHNGTPIPMVATMALCGLLSFAILQMATRRMTPVVETGRP
jgi:MFS transporter, DHA1 family, multidrug resistance protein